MPDMAQELIEKIRDLSPHRIAEVLDFVDFLQGRQNERSLTQAASKLSEDVFKQVWDNPEDEEYDKL